MISNCDNSVVAINIVSLSAFFLESLTLILGQIHFFINLHLILKCLIYTGIIGKAVLEIQQGDERASYNNALKIVTKING